MKGDDGEISLSAGAIGGIAVASLFGLVLLIALGGLFFIYMRVNKEDIRREVRPTSTGSHVLCYLACGVYACGCIVLHENVRSKLEALKHYERCIMVVSV